MCSGLFCQLGFVYWPIQTLLSMSICDLDFSIRIDELLFFFYFFFLRFRFDLLTNGFESYELHDILKLGFVYLLD